MSRTMKDTPYHALEEKAVREGFLLPPVSGPRIRRGRPLVHFIVAVPEGERALADDWMAWMRSIGLSVRIAGTASNGDMVTLSDRYEYCPGIGYMRDFPLGDRSVFDPVSGFFLDSLGYDIRPERNALDPDMSIRDSTVIIINGAMPSVTGLKHVDGDRHEDGDVHGWLAYKSRHDRRYSRSFRWHGKHDDGVCMPRAKVAAALHDAMLAARAGNMDDGFDDPRLYSDIPDTSWYD